MRARQLAMVHFPVRPFRGPAGACGQSCCLTGQCGAHLPRRFFAGLKRPPNGAGADFVLLGQLDDGRTLGLAVGNRAPLTFVESLWSTELGPLALCPFDAFLAALADQAALELGNAAHDGQHQPA
jgi:hypothetical protein